MAAVSPRQLQLHIHSIDSFNEYDQRTENYIYMWFKVKFFYFLSDLGCSMAGVCKNGILNS